MGLQAPTPFLIRLGCVCDGRHISLAKQSNEGVHWIRGCSCSWRWPAALNPMWGSLRRPRRSSLSTEMTGSAPYVVNSGAGRQLCRYLLPVDLCVSIMLVGARPRDHRTTQRRPAFEIPEGGKLGMGEIWNVKIWHNKSVPHYAVVF